MARALAIAFGGAAVATLTAAPALAQSNATGTIFGQVGSAPGATVVLENIATGAHRSITPDAKGRYQATSMPPGRYKVTLERAGAAEKSIEIEALVGQGVDASFADEGTQSVTVSGHRNTIDVSNTDNGATFTAKQLGNLPIAQNVAAIIQLAPGTNKSNNKYPASSFGGAGASENSYYINGFPVTNILTQIGYSELPFGAIANAQILSGGYSAEFGRATGGVVNITTKSGTNNWEVGATMEYAPDRTRAAPVNTYYPNTGANPLTDGKLLTYNQGNTSTSRTEGVYVGGPLIRDQLFMFVALEQTRSDSGSVGATTNTPVSASGYTENTTRTPRYLAKIDYYLNDKNHFEFTKIYDQIRADSSYYGFNYATLSRDYVRNSGMSWVNCCGAANAGANDSIFKYTGFVTDDLTVTALYGRSKTIHSQTPDGYDPSIFQTSSSATTRVPGLSYPTVQTFSGNFPAPGSNDTQKTLRLDVEYKLGSHSLRGGIDDNKVASLVGNVQAGGGSWSYRHYANPNTLPFGATESPAQGGGYGPQGYWVDEHLTRDVANPSSDQSAQYIEDRYQVSDTVLLDLGLRNEQFSNYTSDGQSFMSQRRQLAPRLGATWDYFGDGSLKLYANAGRYHVPLPTNVVRNSAGNFLSTDQAFTYTGVDPATGAPTGLHALSGVTSVNNSFGQSKDPRQAAAIDLKPLYQDELTLGFEKAYSRDLNFGASFTYRTMRSTDDDWCDQRPIDAWGVRNHVDTSNFSFACATINPGQANSLLLDLAGDGKLVRVDLSAADIGLPELKRTYAALNLFAEHPFRDGWYGRINYTYSQSKGNSEGQVDSIGGGDVAVTANWDLREVMLNADGYLPNDHTHVIKAFGYYQLTPAWTVGGNLNLTSGRPVNCLGNLPPSQYAAGDDFAPSYGSDYFFCKGVATPRGSQGRLPWDVQLDLNLAYQPPVLKGLTLKIDVFNVLNRQTVTSVNETYNSDDAINPAYLEVASRQPPRAARFTAEYRHTF